MAQLDDVAPGKACYGLAGRQFGSGSLHLALPWSLTSRLKLHTVFPHNVLSKLLPAVAVGTTRGPR
jgi:hypothetical protein